MTKYIYEENEIEALMMLCANKGAMFIQVYVQNYICEKKATMDLKKDLKEMRDGFLQAKRERNEIIE